MKDFCYLVFSSGALVVVALTAALLEPVWAADLCLNGWTLENLLLPEQRQVLAEQRKTEELERLKAVIKQQHAERVRAAQRLYDGHATLFETAAVFHRLYQNRDPELRRYYPVSTYVGDEQECREVISWMATFFCNRKVLNEKDTAQFVARLEEELQKHKERYGTVTLPGEVTNLPDTSP